MSLGRRIAVAFSCVVLLAALHSSLLGAASDGSRYLPLPGFVLLVGLPALLLGVWLFRSVARPLTRLRTALEAPDDDGLPQPAPAGANDEIGHLGEALNGFADRLRETTLSRSHLDNVLDSVAGALILIGTDHRVVRLNPAALEMLGYTLDELIGSPFGNLGPEADVHAAILTRLDLEGHLRGVESTFTRRDGSTVAVSLSGSVLRSPAGERAGYVCVAHDRSAQKRVADRMRSSLRRKELLLREIHHRVKNNLQVISSLLELEADHSGDPGLMALVRESQNRIRSMALIHEQLYRAPEVDQMNVGDYIENLTGELLRSYGVSPARVDLQLEIEEHPLDIDQALAFGVILNELVANALKHAFSGDRSGAIRIVFGATGDGGLELLVSDDGPGLADDFDPVNSDSLGLTLVASLAQQLRGELTRVAGERTTFRVQFPVVSEEVSTDAG